MTQSPDWLYMSHFRFGSNCIAIFPSFRICRFLCTFIRKSLLHHAARLYTIKFSCYQKFGNFTLIRRCNCSIKKYFTHIPEPNGNLKSFYFIRILLLFHACSLCSACVQCSDLNSNHVTFFRPMKYSYSLSQ